MNKKKVIIIAASACTVVISIVLFFSFICIHKWNEATCSSPSTCVKCGKTRGEVLSHEWVEATCTEAKHCILCGATEGEALGHIVNEWQTVRESNCSVEGERTGFCSRCKKDCIEKINKLPHTKSDWQIKKNFIIDSDGSVTPGTEVIICTVCNEEVESRKYTAELTASQKNTAICAYDEVNFWHCGPDYLIYTILADFNDYPISDAKFVVSHLDIDYDEQAILYAKGNSSGTSKVSLANDMAYYGFTKDQIDSALKEVGY